MFFGLAYCADCGMPVVLHRAHTIRPEQSNFTCHTSKKDGAEVYSAHYVLEVALKKIARKTLCRATDAAKIIVYKKEIKCSKHAPRKIPICFRDFDLNETGDVISCGDTTEKADSATALSA